jgi:hypothetical protein
MSAPHVALYVPVGETFVCLDCSACFHMSVRVCPACASKATYPLSTWLDREPVSA